MEDVLKVQSRDFDDDTVLVCLDETSRQQTRETRTPLPPRPGQPAGFDFEYERNGTANLFMVHAPLIALAPCQGHRPPHQAGLRSRAQGHRGRPLPRQADRLRHGQPQHIDGLPGINSRKQSRSMFGRLRHLTGQTGAAGRRPVSVRLPLSDRDTRGRDFPQPQHG